LDHLSVTALLALFTGGLNKMAPAGTALGAWVRWLVM
jgi:hypothetical protein